MKFEDYQEICNEKGFKLNDKKIKSQKSSVRVLNPVFIISPTGNVPNLVPELSKVRKCKILNEDEIKRLMEGDE